MKKGIHDSRIHEMAGQVTKDTAEVKKESANNEAKKKQMYSREALMPQ